MSNRAKGIALAAVLILSASAANAQQTEGDDWPCIQRLVPELSAAQMWSGPPLDTIEDDWQSDAKIAPLVLDLVDTEMSVDEVRAMIDGFAGELEAQDLSERLPLLFSAVLEMVNGERKNRIRSIKKYAAKQRALAEQIAQDNAKLHGVTLDSTPDEHQLELLAIRERRDWDLRIFDDRSGLLELICEQPVLLEQRAFMLARSIQGQLP